MEFSVSIDLEVSNLQILNLLCWTHFAEYSFTDSNFIASFQGLGGLRRAMTLKITGAPFHSLKLSGDKDC